MAKSGYPDRVTLFSDGVYRWRYDMDLWSNRHMLYLLLKVLGVIFGASAVLFLFMLGKRNITPKVLLITFMVVSGALMAVWIVYYIIARAKKGKYALCFEMDDSAVSLIAPAGGAALDALSIIGAAASVASGEQMPAASLSSRSANGNTPFRGVRKVKLSEKYDVINLRSIGGMNQIYVGKEDYPFVCDFILSRVPEKTRRR